MRQPVEPKEEDCCNSGCIPCIFDVYEKQLAQYKKCMENGETICIEIQSNAISQLEYTPFQLVQYLDICKSYRLLLFRKLHKEGSKVAWKPGDHFLLKYASGSKTCTRAYTPLQLKQFHCDFSVIVKKYDNGLVSTFLWSLVEGQQSLWRGPYGSFELVHNNFDRRVMIAQGTGIVTFISIIEKIINNEDDMTRIMLFYCCPSEDKILLRDELYAFKAYWNFSYRIFLSNASNTPKYKYQEPITHGKLKFENILSLKPFSSKDQFLLCGSQDFMTSYETLLRGENDIEIVVKF